MPSKLSFLICVSSLVPFCTIYTDLSLVFKPPWRCPSFQNKLKQQIWDTMYNAISASFIGKESLSIPKFVFLAPQWLHTISADTF